MTDRLAGWWSGWYDYGDGRARTLFTAHLHIREGALTGSTLEEMPDGGEIAAALTGEAGAQHVSFTKRYLDPPPGYGRPVAYAGEASPQGDRITGQWRIEAEDTLFGVTLHFVGNFEMRRVAGLAAVRAWLSARVGRR